MSRLQHIHHRQLALSIHSTPTKRADMHSLQVPASRVQIKDDGRQILADRIPPLPTIHRRVWVRHHRSLDHRSRMEMRTAWRQSTSPRRISPLHHSLDRPDLRVHRRSLRDGSRISTTTRAIIIISICQLNQHNGSFRKGQHHSIYKSQCLLLVALQVLCPPFSSSHCNLQASLCSKWPIMIGIVCSP